MTDFKQPRRLFLEQHNVRRQAGGDRWLNSGGKKGSIVFWVRPGTRIRKRYGKVVVVNRPELRLRYAEFRLVTGPESNPVCNKEGCTVYVLDVIPKEHAHNSRAAARYPARRPPVVFQGGETGAVVELVQSSTSTTKFISFQAKKLGDDGGELIELGNVVRSRNGVTLSSGQGDFAEWHRRELSEAPLQEGDVIGYTRRGTITRQCSASGDMMLGVVSHKAVVEGSAPPLSERSLYHTVAYCGVVPVRVIPRALGTILSRGALGWGACTGPCASECAFYAVLVYCLGRKPSTETDRKGACFLSSDVAQ